jgi:2,4-diaminopentanoate dehydrogenase
VNTLRVDLPGYVGNVALALTAVSLRIELTMLESVDLRGYANEPMYRAMGIDRDPADPEAAKLIDSRGSKPTPPAHQLY